MRAKLERVAPQVLRTEGRQEWEIGPVVREAAALEDARLHGIKNLDDLAKQQPLGREQGHYSPAAIAHGDRSVPLERNRQILDEEIHHRETRRAVSRATPPQNLARAGAVMLHPAFQKALGNLPPERSYLAEAPYPEQEAEIMAVIASRQGADCGLSPAERRELYSAWAAHMLKLPGGRAAVARAYPELRRSLGELFRRAGRGGAAARDILPSGGPWTARRAQRGAEAQGEQGGVAGRRGNGGAAESARGVESRGADQHDEAAEGEGREPGDFRSGIREPHAAEEGGVPATLLTLGVDRFANDYLAPAVAPVIEPANSAIT